MNEADLLRELDDIVSTVTGRLGWQYPTLQARLVEACREFLQDEIETIRDEAFEKGELAERENRDEELAEIDIGERTAAQKHAREIFAEKPGKKASTPYRKYPYRPLK